MFSKEDAADGMPSKDSKRIDFAKKAVNLPCDFDEAFDAFDKEIEECDLSVFPPIKLQKDVLRIISAYRYPGTIGQNNIIAGYRFYFVQ